MTPPIRSCRSLWPAATIGILATVAPLSAGCDKTDERNRRRLAAARKRAAEEAAEKAAAEARKKEETRSEPPKPFAVRAEWGTAATGETLPPYHAAEAISVDAELRDRLVALAYKPPNKHTIKMLKAKGDVAVRALLRACWFGHDRVRAQAVRLLTRIDFDHALAVEPIKRLLRTDRSATVRAATASALVDLRIPALGDALTEVLSEDKDDSTRANSAWALGKIRHAPAAPALVRALHDPATWVRIRSCTALGRLRAKSARKDLEHALSDPNGEVRKSAARALRKITGRRYSPRSPRLNL